MKLRCFVDGKVVSTPIPEFKNLDELMDVLMEEDFPDTSFQYPDGRLMRYEGLDWPQKIPTSQATSAENEKLQ